MLRKVLNRSRRLKGGARDYEDRGKGGKKRKASGKGGKAAAKSEGTRRTSRTAAKAPKNYAELEIGDLGDSGDDEEDEDGGVEYTKLISGQISELYCFCRSPSSEADKLPMIACDGGCNGWFVFVLFSFSLFDCDCEPFPGIILPAWD